MKKLHKIRQALKPLVKSQSNDHFKSRFFNINQVIQELKPLFDAEGLMILQPLTNVGGQPAIKTIIWDVEGDKLVIEDTFALPNLDNPQKMASCITYMRRYSLVSLLFIESEDDDGNLSAQKSKPVAPLGASINKSKAPF